MKKMLLASIAIPLSTVSAQAKEEQPVVSKTPLASVGMDKSEGCMKGPMEQFGRYLGDWNIADWSLSQDGKTWTTGKGARWNFTCVGNGIAVQDFWMPNGGGQGTNLRMYNAKTQSWDIAWIVKTGGGMTHIGAKQDEAGNIVMRYVSPKPVPDRRITFFAPDDTGWDWHLDVSSDGGKSWRLIYKIRASKR